MSFKILQIAMENNFNETMTSKDCLFEVEVDKDEMWEHYLNSFPSGTNPIFRERTTHDCSCCKNFIRNIGNAVTIEDNHIRTIWDFEVEDETYQTVINAMDEYIESKIVTNVHHTNSKKIGTKSNLEVIDDDTIEWNHFYLELPKKLVTNKSEGSFKGFYRDNKSTLETSLTLISEDSVSTVLELIASNSLYKGIESKDILTAFLELKREFATISEDEKNNWLWTTSMRVGESMCKIKNTSIGTLVINISSGMDLEVAVGKFEAMVAPENYKRSKPIYTKQMLEKAQKTVEEMGFMDSLPRRFANVRDITINDLKFANRTVAKELGVFEKLAKDIPTNPRKFDKIEEIEIEHFMEDVLPHANEVEIFVENKHISNFVSLIAPLNRDTNPMFKWNNNFSWAYSGNMTDSTLKKNVEKAGGDVTGDVRFSGQWNDIPNKHDSNDLDLWCIEPNGHKIYYMNAGVKSQDGGVLDVDIQYPQKNVPAVENIVYANRNTMEDGTYQMIVHNFAHRGGRDGFRAEIEINGDVHTFDYTRELREKESVHVANVIVRNGEISIETKINSEMQERKEWNITTNNFVKVSAICLSPNCWDAEIGNKHYMFMLQDCINPTCPNGFFNEYLKNELYEHRKVFEALGSMMRVEESDEQLSGLGFSSTQRNEFVVRVKGQVDRLLKVKV